MPILSGLPPWASTCGTYMCPGVRADDMRLRLKYAGVDEARIEVFYDYDPLIDAMCASEYPVFIMPTYTSMLDLRGRLQKQLGGKEFWE